MKIYLISNNLLLDGMDYESGANLEQIRLIRPLSIEGEKLAQKMVLLPNIQDIEKIYASFYSSALSTAKYFALKFDLEITLREELNDCKVGELRNKTMKMVKGMQDHDFRYNLPGGESLIDVGNRIEEFIKKVSQTGENSLLFTHKRAILGFLLKYSQVGYNLDDNLILEYNNQIVYDDSETYFDIYEITLENREIVDIKRI